MSLHYKKQLRPLAAALSIILLTTSGTALAGGFQLFEQNAVGVGNFDAGAAAEASDASIGWYNPAGLVRLQHQQFVLGSDAINAGIRFSGNVVNNVNAVLPIIGEVTLPASNEYGHAEGGGFIPVPFFHYALPIGDRFVFGFSSVAPFGLVTNYDDESVLRYSATKSSITAVDLTPSLAVKLTDKFSAGAGIDFVRINAEFNQMVGLGEVGPALDFPEDTDSESINKAADWALGWHAGLMYQFSPTTRVGLAYHSKLNVSASGYSKLKGPLASLATDGASDSIVSNDLQADVELPALTTLSIYHDVNDRWAVMGSVNYTQWKVFDNLPLQNAAAIQQAAGLIPGFDPAIINVNVPQHFHNTWRVAGGINFKQTDWWMWRAGLGFDQDPTNDTDRNVRLPDADRFNVALGAHFQPIPQLGFDAGWTHVFLADGVIDNLQAVGDQVTYVNGHTDSNGDIFGLQLVWTIT